MTVNVSFRVVGLYCYFENLAVPNVTETSSVKDVMDQIAGVESAFSYTHGATPVGKDIVDSMTYTFSAGSRVPYNSSTPSDGKRSMANVIPGQGSTANALVWQYYRSVTVGNGGPPYEIKLITPGQPSFATTALNQDVSIPDGYTIGAYNLTWRLVQIEMTPEKQQLFLAAKMGALSK